MSRILSLDEYKARAKEPVTLWQPNLDEAANAERMAVDSTIDNLRDIVNDDGLRLAILREAFEAATPGQWCTGTSQSGLDDVLPMVGHETSPPICRFDWLGNPAQAAANMRFIVSARQNFDFMWLLAAKQVAERGDVVPAPTYTPPAPLRFHAVEEPKLTPIPQHIKDAYVSSSWRGFWVITDRPFCHTGVGSGNGTLITVKSIVRQDGAWFFKDDNPGQIWLTKAWNEYLKLVGGEPWRIYEVPLQEVGERLDAGETIDDVRGFKNRLEPWQPLEVGEEPEDVRTHVQGYRGTAASTAVIWGREDGWLVRLVDGLWVADGTECNADPSGVPKTHFDPVLKLPGVTAQEMMTAVDQERPWL